jgi:hypothetical protein
VQAISSSGGTAISDALIEASRLVPHRRRHVIVLITGSTTNSQARWRTPTSGSAHASVYVIGVGSVAGIR